MYITPILTSITITIINGDATDAKNCCGHSSAERKVKMSPSFP